MIFEGILLVVGSYLLGSISASYLVGKRLRGKDLRQYDSGTPGGLIANKHVGH
ncbi:MAG TPA: glycerol-3-phosphate acyltransferase [Anaerolineae bacterium]|nr:glycerol-3-phosphate acyltransferase [Anaerolineae bacterium]